MGTSRLPCRAAGLPESVASNCVPSSASLQRCSASDPLTGLLFVVELFTVFVDVWLKCHGEALAFFHGSGARYLEFALLSILSVSLFHHFRPREVVRPCWIADKLVRQRSSRAVQEYHRVWAKEGLET
jgi:hypothetical protein